MLQMDDANQQITVSKPEGDHETKETDFERLKTDIERMETLADVAVKELVRRQLIPAIAKPLFPFPCTDCEQSFSSKSRLNKHRKSEHGKEYSCDLCNEKFNSSTEYKRHCSTKHEIDRPFGCGTCGRKFVHESALIAHLRTHTNDRPYRCDQCGMAFTQSSTLFSHQKRHSGVTPFKCSVCGKSFAVKGDLRTHYRTHNAEKPFSCEICGKSFPRKSNFSRHLRTHTGEKPYSCKHCDKRFSRAEKCQEHERTHTNERPFSCPDCGLTFKDSGNFCSHRKLHKNGRQPRKRALKMPCSAGTYGAPDGVQYVIESLQQVIAGVDDDKLISESQAGTIMPDIESTFVPPDCLEISEVDVTIKPKYPDGPVVIERAQQPARTLLKSVQSVGVLKPVLLNKTTLNNVNKATLSNARQFIPLADTNLQNNVGGYLTFSTSPEKTLFSVATEDTFGATNVYVSEDIINTPQRFEPESNSLNNQAFLMLDCFPRDTNLSFSNDSSNALVRNSSVFLQPSLSELQHDASIYNISIMENDLSSNMPDTSYNSSELPSDSHSLLSDGVSFLNRSELDVRTTLDTNTFLNDDYILKSDNKT